MYRGLLTVKVLVAFGCGQGLPPALGQGGLGRRRWTNLLPGMSPGATGAAAAGMMPATLGGHGSSPPSCWVAAEHNTITNTMESHGSAAARCCRGLSQTRCGHCRPLWAAGLVTCGARGWLG